MSSPRHLHSVFVHQGVTRTEHSFRIVVEKNDADLARGSHRPSSRMAFVTSGICFPHDVLSAVNLLQELEVIKALRVLLRPFVWVCPPGR